MTKEKELSIFSKMLAYLRWGFYGCILYFHFIVLSYIFYPLSYVFRNILRKFNILSLNRFLYIFSIILFIFSLYYFIYNYNFINFYYTIGLFLYSSLFWWIFLDDSVVKKAGDDYGEEWWKINNGININKLNEWGKFKVAYRWGVLRNPAWNYHTIFKPKENNPNILYSEGKLVKNDREVDIMNFATLKWEDDEGDYSGNQGKYISNKFTTWGKSFVWYKIDKNLYWRYSYVGKTPKWLYLITRKEWMELHLGTSNRYTFRWKLKNGMVRNSP